ncbi:MAG: aminoglycoside phosphotransferase family protein [Kutzneria sp.]|nr:aminoglycoside phosphotransferase family protein [Kutzneria sp.]
MTTGMHNDEVATDVPLVRRLLATQFPAWTGLAVQSVASSGTDNAMYRLGADMVVRLPRVPAAATQVDKEQRWLPRLAPHLPLSIPTPVGRGAPAEGYPWCWSVYRWLDGHDATVARITDTRLAARTLAGFVTALRRLDPTNGPACGAGNFFRGAPLTTREEPTREAITALNGMRDTSSVTKVWETALNTPPWHGPSVWIHGDLAPGNLLVRRGRLGAVVDFGALGVGDPACDLMVAWNLFSAEARNVFRGSLAVDDATWLRGRAWALSVALIQVPYYQNTNPVLAARARRTIDEVLSDHP